MSILSLSLGVRAIDVQNGSTDQMIPQLDAEKYLISILTIPYASVNLAEDVIYEEFVSSLQRKTTQSLQDIRIAKLAAKKLETQYLKEPDFKTQGLILMALNRLTQNALTYAIRNNNQLLQNHFLKIIKFVSSEGVKRVIHGDPNSIAYVPDKRRQIEVFVTKLESAIKRLNDGIHPKDPTETVEFRKTKIQITFRELLVKEKIGNVIYPASLKGRKRAYTFTIIEPSIDASEASLLTVKTLLASEFVEGVYLDDRLRIPSKMSANSYELSYLGANILLKRPSCSKLFQ